ncbi:N-6 DNA Methylase [Fodinibius roseus]|uniref:N-6 DNA Methylase n=1 Tax=Fodinibius roseus TaxID=1194090 RepID=A0A1M5KGC4_9BACT|nr:N-6 DNA methylase [Fodinibius roseus]SHG51906.1 N-6 DNA Methylase [Fodinibius roseus]
MDFKANQTDQKLRGGYYTPLDLAEFMAKWVTKGDIKKILEPSSGDGNFFQALSRIVRDGEPEIKVTGVELNKEEVEKSRERIKTLNNIQFEILNEDYLEWGLKSQNNNSFDAVIGNPPFIRYQYLPKEYQDRAEKIFDLYNLKFTKHTNAWVPFVVQSFEMLNPGGRLAMILPSELMHVSHAQSLREYLGKNSEKILILDPKELWFEDTLQGALILFAEKKKSAKDKSRGLGIKEITNRSFADDDPHKYFKNINFINGETITGKWTKAVLNKKELELIKEIKCSSEAYQFKEIADASVGIVTGANKYFLINKKDAREFGIEDWSHPMFGRSEHCPKLVYDEDQHNRNIEKELPTEFIWFDVDKFEELGEDAQKYVKKGEDKEYHKRYKCRIRDPWFKVPSVYATEIGMLKRSHNYHRLILNEINAYTTDTAYRIKLKTDSIEPHQLVYNFLNSFTALTAELEGRFYGGGVLELIPSEIKKTYVPIINSSYSDLKELDKKFNSLDPEEVLKQQDEHILKSFGLSKNDRNIIHNAWQKLRDRRQRK